MREIKFRAWDSKLRCMIVQTDVVAFWSAVEDRPVMQYTGLKDKNGVEIYEGDIVKMPAQWWHDDWQVGANKLYHDEVVEAPIGNRLFAAGDWSVETEDCEVIGNIYENPGHS